MKSNTKFDIKDRAGAPCELTPPPKRASYRAHVCTHGWIPVHSRPANSDLNPAIQWALDEYWLSKYVTCKNNSGIGSRSAWPSGGHWRPW